jgi:hypothetical protein
MPIGIKRWKMNASDFHGINTMTKLMLWRTKGISWIKWQQPRQRLICGMNGMNWNIKNQVSEISDETNGLDIENETSR